MGDVFEYKVQGPEDFSQKLIEHNSLHKESSGSMTAMQVILRSGYKIDGYPVRISGEGNSKYLLLCSEPNPSPTKPHSLTFVDLKNIEAVGVVDAHLLTELLTSGEVSLPVPWDQIPSRLELRKKISKVMETLSVKIDIDSKMSSKIEEPDSDRLKYFIGQFFDGLQQAFQDIGQDDIGKSSLEEIKTIKVTIASEMHLSKEAEELSIRFGTDEKIINYKQFLKEKIEAVL